MTCLAPTTAFTAPSVSARVPTYSELGINHYEISMCGDAIGRDVWICDQQASFDSDEEYVAALPRLVQEMST